MANVIYPLGKQAFLSGSINMTTDTIKAVLVTSGYTYASTDQYLTALGANTVGTAQVLTSPTDTNGVFNAAGVTFLSVLGSASSYVVVYKDTGTASTSPLIVYIDTATGLPVTPNGGNITITWDTGANKIFAL